MRCVAPATGPGMGFLASGPCNSLGHKPSQPWPTQQDCTPQGWRTGWGHHSWPLPPPAGDRWTCSVDTPSSRPWRSATVPGLTRRPGSHAGSACAMVGKKLCFGCEHGASATLQASCSERRNVQASGDSLAFPGGRVPPCPHPCPCTAVKQSRGESLAVPISMPCHGHHCREPKLSLRRACGLP